MLENYIDIKPLPHYAVNKAKGFANDLATSVLNTLKSICMNKAKNK